MKKKIAILALMFVVLPTVVFAQAGTTTTTTTPTTTTTTAPSTNPCTLNNAQQGNTTTTLPQCINQIYVWSLGLSVLLAMLMIVIGGYYYMTSGGNAEQASKGKEYITSALIGVVILFCAYLLLNEINPDLVNFNLNSLNGLNSNQTPATTTK